MLTVVSRWETSQLHPLEEWQLWRQLRGAFGIDRFVMVPKQEDFDRVSIIDQFDTMEEALAFCEGRGERVFLEPNGRKTMAEIPKGDIVLICGNTPQSNMMYAKIGEMYAISTKGETRHNHLYGPNAAAIALAIRLGQ